MITVALSTLHTTVAAGRAAVLSAIATQFAGSGFGPYVPPNPVRLDHIHMEIPGSVVAPALPAQWRALAEADTIVVDTADGLSVRPDGTVTGYWFNMLIALRYRDDLTDNLLAFFASRWRSQTTTTRAATTEELALDPGRPALAWKLRDGVRYWNNSIRHRKGRFSGEA